MGKCIIKKKGLECECIRRRLNPLRRLSVLDADTPSAPVVTAPQYVRRGQLTHVENLMGNLEGSAGT